MARPLSPETSVVSRNDLLDFHRFLLADSSRTRRYRDAINRVVREGDVVLDLGAGTGILSCFACLAGARKVYAVEISDAIEFAKEIRQSNGLGDRIELIKERSQNVALPEPVDVVIADVGASFGLQDGALGSLLDARRRCLKPGGRIIPSAFQLFVAPIELDDKRSLNVWAKDCYGVDLSSIRRFAANTNYHFSLNSGLLLGPPAALATIHFESVNSSYLAAEASCVATRDGRMHGVAGWITEDLAPGIAFTNSPIAPTVDWTQSFFPVQTPVELQAGDYVRVRIKTNDGQIWRWQIEVTGGQASGPGVSSVKARFDHSTLWSLPISKRQIKSRILDYAPRLSRKGQAELQVLNAVDGVKTVEDLAKPIHQQFADCFPSKAAATEFVSKVVARCT